MKMDLSLFSTAYVPANKRKNKTYRVLRNGQPLGYIDASSPVVALSRIIASKKPSSPIKRIGCGAVTDVNNQHYQAVEA